MDMKYTGVFATPEEVEELSNVRNNPVMLVGRVQTGNERQEAAHALALKHGLPEIPGFYGIDLGTGEFVTA